MRFFRGEEEDFFYENMLLGWVPEYAAINSTTAYFGSAVNDLWDEDRCWYLILLVVKDSQIFPPCLTVFLDGFKMILKFAIQNKETTWNLNSFGNLDRFKKNVRTLLFTLCNEIDTVEISVTSARKECNHELKSQMGLPIQLY